MPSDTSIETRSIREFSAADYVVFAILLVLNAGIGLFYAIKERRDKKETINDYMLGGRSQSVVPVALSLTVTFLSANTLLGTPVEMYNFNTMFIYLALGMLFATVVSAWIFIPFFYRLGFTSIFQYLEVRFSPAVRMLGAFFLVCQMLLYMGFVLYAPSLALSAVTGLSFEGCVVGMGVVVTFYTTLGGMKAVLWTDTYQSIIIYAGLLAVFIKGIQVAGGFSAAWELADERGRILLDDFSFEPSTRHSFFTVVVGGGFFWLSLYGVNQAQVQRCLSTSSITRARLAILISTPFLLFLAILCCLIGIVMFAFYADCDPVKFGVIDKKDQLLPLYMLDILGHLHGLAGLFVAGIFNGSLSTLSSGLNSLGAIILKEVQHGTAYKFTEKKAVLFTKIFVIIFGAAVIGLAFLVSELGTLQEASMTVYGIINGPVFGVFILGMFFPWANSIGAFCGCVASLAFMGWIGIGAYVHEIRTATPSPTTTVGCHWPNGTAPALSNATRAAPKVFEGVERVYTLSYLNYTLVGMLTVIVVGLLVSFLTGYTRPSKLNPKYVVPMFYLMSPPQSQNTADGGPSKVAFPSVVQNDYYMKDEEINETIEGQDDPPMSHDSFVEGHKENGISDNDNKMYDGEDNKGMGDADVAY